MEKRKEIGKGEGKGGGKRGEGEEGRRERGRRSGFGSPQHNLGVGGDLGRHPGGETEGRGEMGAWVGRERHGRVRREGKEESTRRLPRPERKEENQESVGDRRGHWKDTGRG